MDMDMDMDMDTEMEMDTAMDMDMETDMEMYMEVEVEMEICINLYHFHTRLDSGNSMFFFYCLHMLESVSCLELFSCTYLYFNIVMGRVAYKMVPSVDFKV